MKSQGGKSKKSRQTILNKSSGKYLRQKRRTNTRKIRVLEMYLLEHPKDKQNRRDIERKLKSLI